MKFKNDAMLANTAKLSLISHYRTQSGGPMDASIGNDNTLQPPPNREEAQVN